MCVINDISVIELAKEGIPLPFGSKFWATKWPIGKAPFPGLLLHLIPTASNISALQLIF